jgi:4-hydroxybutyrate CoA-transferase
MEAALVARAEELEGVEVGPLFPQVPSPMTGESLDPHFHRWCIYALPAIREQVQARRIGMAPPLLGLYQRLEESDRDNPHAWDVFICRGSPPDENGVISLGNGIWYSKLSIRCSRIVIIEVDESVPRPFGDNSISIDDVDLLVEHETSHDYVPPRVGGSRQEASDVIGAYAAGLVHDGDTLQIGGGVASAGLYSHLWAKQDLGYHAELAEEMILDLVEAGVINGKRKTLNPGQAVAAYIRGGARINRLIDRNPAYAIYGSDYTNNPAVIAQHENFVAVNTCIASDLTGQVTSESIDGRLFGGPGGQLEFVIGSLLAKGGRSIMCLPSTTSDGRSRIVANHPAGTVISTPRLFADYFVTEFGVAALMGKTERQRANELIAIAHPDHRAALRAAAAHSFSEVI